MRYLKKKDDPDHIYHVWMPELAKREDMVEFVPQDVESVAEPVIEPVVELSGNSEQLAVGKFTTKSVGFGKFKVIDGAGEFVTGAMPKEDAEKEAARLNGEA